LVDDAVLLAAEDVDDELAGAEEELAGTEDELATDDEITAAADDELASADDTLDCVETALDKLEELCTAVVSSRIILEAADETLEDFDELLTTALLELLDDDELAGGVSLLSLLPPQAVMVKTIALISKSFFIA